MAKLKTEGEKMMVRVRKMDRVKVVYELRRYAHPSHYHLMLTWSTPILKRMLGYYIHDVISQNKQ